MNEGLNSNEILINRINQLEHERDELRKDIEQLCLQQAGPAYLVVATKIHFQRTAALEGEIENLKCKLAGCVRDNQNLREELSEIYRVKSQLADLHSAEVAKNMETERQLKFFQGCVASAFAERDQALMEAEKFKEHEDSMLCKLNDAEKRVEKLQTDYLEEQKLNSSLQFEMVRLKALNDIFLKVINKFYEIRHKEIEVGSCEEKCLSLLDDPSERWHFDEFSDNSTKLYILRLEEEQRRNRSAIENLKKSLSVGLEIEDHLKKKVYMLEEKKMFSERILKQSLSDLREFHTLHRCEVLKLLEEEKAQIQSMIYSVDEKEKHLHPLETSSLNSLSNMARNEEDAEYKDVHINTCASMVSKNGCDLPIDIGSDVVDTSAIFAQALEEKVSALLLLSQQEERHLLEKNVNASIHRQFEELQRNLHQVTDEKVEALMQLAQLRLDNERLKKYITSELKKGKNSGDVIECNYSQEKDGKLRALLKRANIRQWVSRLDPRGVEASLLRNTGDRSLQKESVDFDVDRLRAENATLQDSMANMDHLTSSIHKLRISLQKVMDIEDQPRSVENKTESLQKIITDANDLKMSLTSSLPFSWSPETEVKSSEDHLQLPTECAMDFGRMKVDSVSSVGFEMVELLVMAAQLQITNLTRSTIDS